MLIYLFDGSWEGFLSCVYQTYYSKETPSDIQIKDACQQNFFATYKTIETCVNHAKKVDDAIYTKIGFEAHSHAYHCFLSDTLTSYQPIYQYLQLGFKVGSQITTMHAHHLVLPIEKLSQKVGYEAHRMLGFVRFRHQIGNFYFAEISPDHCILPLIGHHFKNRMADQDWIIYDKKRHIAIAYNAKQREYAFSTLPNELVNQFINSKKETTFSLLWKDYHKNLAIEARKNLKLQRQFVPLRYRKHLTEFNLTPEEQSTD